MSRDLRKEAGAEKDEASMQSPAKSIGSRRKRVLRWVTSHDESALEVEHPPLPWSLRILFSVVVVAVLASVGWRLSGGSSYVVGSTSMCPNVCVGALVLDRPVVGELRAGDIVTFTPPGFSVAYSHRIVKVLNDGEFLTKGDAANIIDPWKISRKDIHGRVVATIFGLGWLERALMFLSAGMALILVFRRQAPALVRRDWDRLGAVVLIALPLWLLHPLIRGVLVSSTRIGHGRGRVQIVNTGLFSAQFRVVGGEFRDFIRSGQRVTMTGPIGADGQVHVTEFASFHWGGWFIIWFVVFSPLLGYLLRRYRLRKKGLGLIEA